MNVLYSLLLAFAMFTRLPLPRLEWRRERLAWLLVFLPLVGLVVGLSTTAWWWLADSLQLGPFLRGVGFSLLPLAITGGLHVDGLADVSDARATPGGREEKIRVLHDPRSGPFAALAVTSHFLLFAALAAELPPGRQTAWLLPGIFIISRSVAGLLILGDNLIQPTGLAWRFRQAAGVGSQWLLWLGFTLGALLLVQIGGGAGAVAAAAGGGALVLARRVARRELGGVNGDLAGWLILRSELFALAGLVAGNSVLSWLRQS